MRICILVTLFLATFFSPLFAQVFFLTDTVSVNIINGPDRRHIIDLNTCTWGERPGDVIPINPTGISFRAPDMTITGRIGLDLQVALMFDIDNSDNINNRVREDVVVYNAFIPVHSASNGPPFAPETAPRGISTDYRYSSFLLGNHLTRIVERYDQVYSLGLIPPEMRPKGQMTFREGSFYYPSVNNELIQLKVAEPDFWLRAIGPLPDTLNYGGIFSIPHSCDSTRTFVLHHDPQRGSTMYKLDIPSLELTEHCTMPFKPMSAAFEGENTLPPCDWSLDLDTRSDTTLVRYDTICTESLALLDEYIHLTPDLEFDSLVITLTNPLDGAAESLALSGSHPEVRLSNSSQRIVLASTGFTKGSTMLNLLPGLSYQNTATVPTAGLRNIEVTYYHPFHGELSSRIALYLSAGTNNSSVLQTTSCQGSSFSLAGASYTQDTTFQLSLTNRFGCDSLVEVQLSFADTFAQSFQYELCPGESLALGDQLITTDSVFSLRLQTTAGCDSVLHYTVALRDLPRTSESAAICVGESYTFAGQTYREAGEYIDTLQAANGCDSLHVLRLSVDELPAPIVETLGTLCGDGEVSLGTSTSYASYQWSGGVATPTLVATAPGIYELAVTDSNGCVGNTSIELTNSPPEVVYTIQQPDCETTDGSLLLEDIQGGNPPWYLNGQVVEAGTIIPAYLPGTYEVVISDSEDCTTDLRFTIFPVEALSATLPAAITVEAGQSIPLPLSTTAEVATVSWSPATGLSCTDCLQPLVNTFTPTTYEVTLTDDQGCEWTGRIAVNVKQASLYVPNAFSPNGDGVNEVFQVYPSTLVRRLSVYDRWGAQVFVSKNGAEGWDGRVKGKPAGAGVYLYVVEWQDVGGALRTESGELTLLR